MSRIGNSIINIPEGVTVEVKENLVIAKVSQGNSLKSLMVFLLILLTVRLMLQGILILKIINQNMVYIGLY